jgi:hypothetical protein
MDLSHLTAAELLSLHVGVGDELRARGITRSSNNPTGDLAEYLFRKAFGWEPAGNSTANFDATDREGNLYQIKGRRITRLNPSRQLSAIRDLAGGHFHFLAGVIFAEDYSVQRAAIIPHAVIAGGASFVERTNSHKFLLRDNVWDLRGVRDVTPELRALSL